MDKIEAQQRYGDAIAQILTKYAGVIESPKKFTKDDGVKILNQQIKPKMVKPGVKPAFEISSIRSTKFRFPSAHKVGSPPEK